MSKDLFGAPISVAKPFIDRELLTQQLRAIISKWTLQDLVNALTSEFDEIVEYANLFNGAKTCQRTSLLFNPHRLQTKTKSSKLSIFDALNTDSFISGLARVSLLNHDKVNDILYQSIQLGVNGIQYVNEFPPHVARELSLQFNCNASSRVLDPCAGWGGRMIGLSTIVNEYDCFEPSTKTYEGLQNLAQFISKLNQHFKPRISNYCFEDAKLADQSYDFALTSPPYYDTEEYSDEPTNSLNRYKSFSDWCQGFYCPMIAKTMNALKPGATFVLNIGSRKYPLNEVLQLNFSQRYTITRLDDRLSGNSSGLGKSGEGETFYAITKPV